MTTQDPARGLDPRSRPILTLTFSALLFLAGCGAPAPEPNVDASSSPPKTIEKIKTTAEPPEGMVFIPGGSFMMGGDAGEMGGGSNSHQTSYPIKDVYVDGFWMDASEVTNAQFQEFVEATGFITFAERPLPEARVAEFREMAQRSLAEMRAQLPNAQGDDRVGLLATIKRVEDSMGTLEQPGAIVFTPPEGQIYSDNDINQWWRIVPGATWRQPEGPGSTWIGREDHPVVNVTHADAAAYAKWAGKRLPTEAEWEKAARGGLDRQPFVWGAEFAPKGEDVWMANIWQGAWPYQNTAEDGFARSSPVRSFPENAYGLYDIAGNVWEIVADLYHPRAYDMREAGAMNPTGPRREQILQPGQSLITHITRGGSFLCSDGWCKGYQPGSRQPIDNESPASHTGFRCVKDIPGA